MTVAAAPLTPVRSSGEKIDDASVTARVKGVLAGHRSTRAATIGVVTLNGEVTLTGIAGNAAEKRLAGKIVSDVDGVKKVRNQMTVNPFETR
jgi:hyperosmotically inducible protein